MPEPKRPRARSCPIVDEPGTDPHIDPDTDLESRHPERRHLERLSGALAALDDQTLRSALAAMSENNRLEVASALQLPKAAMHLGDALVPLVRRKLRTAGAQHQLAVGFAVSEQVNDDTIAVLGDRSDDPTHDDMLEVLPGVVERHGVPLVVVMLASYAASDAPCQDVFAQLLDTDERFAVPEPVPVDDGPDLAAPAAGASATRDDPAQAEKRAQRKAAKEARREAEAQQRAVRAAAQAKRKVAQREAKRSREQ